MVYIPTDRSRSNTVLSWFGFWGLGFGVLGVGFGVWDLGFGEQGWGLRVWGLGFKVFGSGFKMTNFNQHWGLGLGHGG